MDLKIISLLHSVYLTWNFDYNSLTDIKQFITDIQRFEKKWVSNLMFSKDYKFLKINSDTFFIEEAT